MAQDSTYYDDPRSGNKFQAGDYQTRMNVARPKGGYILTTRDKRGNVVSPPKGRKKRAKNGRS